MIENKAFQVGEKDHGWFSYSQSMVDANKRLISNEFKNKTSQSLKLFIFLTILLFILSGLSSLLILHFFPKLSLVIDIFINLMLLIFVLGPLFIIFAYQPLMRNIHQERETKVFLEHTNEKIQKLEFVLEKSPTIIYDCFLSDGLPIKYISKNVNHFGYSAEVMVNTGSCFSDLIHPDDSDRIMAEIYESIAAGLDEFTLEFRILSKEGDVRWVISNNWINRNLKRVILNFQGVMLDITNRKLFAQNLQQAEQMAESMFSISHVLKSHLDHNYNFLRVNAAFSETLGKSIVFFHGKNFFDIFPDMDIKNKFEEVLKDKETIVIHDQKIPGSLDDESFDRYFDWVVQPIKNIQNDQIEIMLSLIDVTDHALARQNIIAERNKLVQIFNAMNDGIYIINEKHEIEYMNPTIQQLFGKFNYEKCYEYFQGANEPCSFCRFSGIKSSKVANYEQEEASIGKIFDVVDIRLDNPDGSLSKIKVMHDITKRKENEKQLQLLSNHQTRILEDERQYISRELHDEVSQVISGAILGMQLIETKVDNRDFVLEKVNETSKMLESVSENIHNIALRLRPASLDHLGLVPAINQYVDAIMGMGKVDIVVKSDGINHRLPTNIETMIYRIVQEALTNVIRHSYATKAEVVLKITDSVLVVCIEDNGIGFDPNVAPTPSHIGLLGMRERVQILNGKLIIESAYKRGTKVFVEVNCDNPDSGC